MQSYHNNRLIKKQFVEPKADTFNLTRRQKFLFKKDKYVHKCETSRSSFPSSSHNQLKTNDSKFCSKKEIFNFKLHEFFGIPKKDGIKHGKCNFINNN